MSRNSVAMRESRAWFPAADFFIGSSAVGEASQADSEIPLSLEMDFSKNTPHSSLEHSEKLPKSS